MNPFHIVVVLRAAAFNSILNFFILVGVLFALLLWWDHHKTTSEYDAAKPYILPIDKQTSLPIVNLENLKNNKFDYNSHSFFKSTKNGLFILTGGFWADISYRDIIELTENERPNKNLRTFKVVVQWREGFFPESCFDSIPKNLQARESKIESWINSHNTMYTFVDQRIDVPILQPFESICKGFLGTYKFPFKTGYYGDKYASLEDAEKRQITTRIPTCTLYTGIPIWSNKKDACKIKTSVYGARWNDSDKLYDLSSGYAGAEVLNEQFREYLEALKPEKKLAAKDVHGGINDKIDTSGEPQSPIQLDKSESSPSDVDTQLICGKDAKADCSI